MPAMCTRNSIARRVKGPPDELPIHHIQKKCKPQANKEKPQTLNICLTVADLVWVARLAVRVRALEPWKYRKVIESIII